MLQHPDPRIASTTALGMWYAYKGEQLPPTLRNRWEQIIVEMVTHNYILEEIFHAKPDVAERWLYHKLDTPHFADYAFEKTMEVAVRSLSLDAQHALLRVVAERAQSPELFGYINTIIVALTNDEIALFADAMNSDTLRPFHLSLLSNRALPDWVDRAKIAFERGYSVDAIYQNLISPLGVSMRWGNDSDWWAEWSTWFAQLTGDGDERIQWLGRFGVERAKKPRQTR